MSARLAPDLLSGVGFLAFNLAVGAGAINLGVGSVSEPGPGMYPLVLACAGVGLSIALAIGGLKPAAAVAPAISAQPAMATNWRAVGTAMIALTAYALLLPVFGIAVPSVILMAVLFWMGGLRNLPLLIALALGLGIGADVACRLMGIPPPEPMIWQLIGGV